MLVLRVVVSPLTDVTFLWAFPMSVLSVSPRLVPPVVWVTLLAIGTDRP